MVDDDQYAMSDSDDCFLFPKAASKTVILSGEVIVFGVRNRPDNLCEDSSQIRIALGRFATQPFASTLSVSRAQASPRGEVRGTRKAAHVLPNFSENGRRCRFIDARNTHEPRHGFFKWTKVGVNVCLQLFEG